MINTIKNNPESNKMGMILCHNGIVRGYSKDGRKVKGLKVKLDRTKLRSLINRIKNKPGIIDVLVDIREGKLKVGEDIMFIVIAGDIRENVFPALEEAVNSIKSDVLQKEEEI
jgi:molybdopterin synthase catalytic subunit